MNRGPLNMNEGALNMSRGVFILNRGSAHIEQQNKIYIDNKENKENHNERSEFNKELI